MLLTIVAALVYVWAVRSGQYDDLDRQGDAILLDDLSKEPDEKPKPEQ